MWKTEFVDRMKSSKKVEDLRMKAQGQGRRKVDRLKPDRKFTAKSHWQEPAVEPRQNSFVGGSKRGKNSREQPLLTEIVRRREEQ